MPSEQFRPTNCGWCHKKLCAHPSGKGRPKEFCNATCRGRAQRDQLAKMRVASSKSSPSEIRARARLRAATVLERVALQYAEEWAAEDGADHHAITIEWAAIVARLRVNSGAPGTPRARPIRGYTPR